MSSRLEIELTSVRPDGVWTWRKAGAKLPKGEVAGSVLPDGLSVGDVVRAEVNIMVDGVEILEVLPPKGERKDRFESLTVVGTRTDEPLVTQTLAPKGRGGGRGDRDRGDRGGRGGRDRDRGGRDERGRGDRGSGRGPGGAGRAGGDDQRPDRGPRRSAPVDSKPRPKRLRPGRAHRNAVLETLAAEQRPIAEQVLRGGVPAVRQEVDKQNADNRAKGLPEIHGDEIVALAESMLPKLRTAEWRDKADNALAILSEIDLRDLRSVVVAADSGARDDETRALAQQLRDGLTTRVEQEHSAWLADLTANLDEGRIVRALRLSSRPPKAGAPVPAEVSTKLVALTLENLTLETSQDRWAMVIDALAFSPVRTAVTPGAIPPEPTEALVAAVAKVASRVPHIAQLFGIDPSAAPKRTRTRSAAPAKRGPRTEAPAKPQATDPVEDVVPAEDVAPEENVVPAEDVTPVEEVVPAAEVAVADELAPAPEVAAAEDVAPAEDVAAPEEVGASVEDVPGD